MKIIKFILIALFLTANISVCYAKIHIWVDKDQDDYSWENDLVTELRNSKYSSLFGNYNYSMNWDNVNSGDYIIYIIKGSLNETYYGSYTLYKVDFINNSKELLYRMSFIFSGSKNSKLDWVISAKNEIISLIDKGYTKY